MKFIHHFDSVCGRVVWNWAIEQGDVGFTYCFRVHVQRIENGSAAASGWPVVMVMDGGNRGWSEFLYCLCGN